MQFQQCTPLNVINEDICDMMSFHVANVATEQASSQEDNFLEI